MHCSRLTGVAHAEVRLQVKPHTDPYWVCLDLMVTQCLRPLTQVLCSRPLDCRAALDAGVHVCLCLPCLPCSLQACPAPHESQTARCREAAQPTHALHQLSGALNMESGQAAVQSYPLKTTLSLNRASMCCSRRPHAKAPVLVNRHCVPNQATGNPLQICLFVQLACSTCTGPHCLRSSSP